VDPASPHPRHVLPRTVEFLRSPRVPGSPLNPAELVRRIAARL
jgi:hypothetical protein